MQLILVLLVGYVMMRYWIVSYALPGSFYLQGCSIFASLIFWLFFGHNEVKMFSLICFTELLLVLSVIDGCSFLLPDSLTGLLLGIGLVVNSGEVFVSEASALMGVFIAYVSLLFLGKMVSWYCGKPALGGGDVKLFAAIAGWVGLGALPFILWFSVLFGLAFLVLRRACLKISLREAMPFGPCLALSGWLGLIFSFSG